jgi:hypothetical protein
LFSFVIRKFSRLIKVYVEKKKGGGETEREKERKIPTGKLSNLVSTLLKEEKNFREAVVHGKV